MDRYNATVFAPTGKNTHTHERCYMHINAEKSKDSEEEMNEERGNGDSELTRTPDNKICHHWQVDSGFHCIHIQIEKIKSFSKGNQIGE